MFYSFLYAHKFVSFSFLLFFKNRFLDKDMFTFGMICMCKNEATCVEKALRLSSCLLLLLFYFISKKMARGRSHVGQKVEVYGPTAYVSILILN